MAKNKVLPYASPKTRRVRRRVPIFEVTAQFLTLVVLAIPFIAATMFLRHPYGWWGAAVFVVAAMTWFQFVPSARRVRVIIICYILGGVLTSGLHVLSRNTLLLHNKSRQMIAHISLERGDSGYGMSNIPADLIISVRFHDLTFDGSFRVWGELKDGTQLHLTAPPPAGSRYRGKFELDVAEDGSVTLTWP